jgi:hypothetical protein
MRVERWYGVENYAKAVEAQDWSRSSYGPRKGDYYGGGSWDDNVGWEKAMEFTKFGDPKLVSKASETVDRLVENFQITQIPRKQYISSIAGSRVSVPEYLAGSPFCMKRRVPREMAVRSINIYVSTTCAAAIDAKNMLKRGATILALLEYLQVTQVAVGLYLLAETYGRTDGDFIQVIQVESDPLDLSTAGFAIAHPSFARHLTYGMAEKMDGFNGAWGREHGTYGENPNYVKHLSEKLGMGVDDIYIPSPTWRDEMIISKPDQWLAARIEKIQAGVQ